MNDAIMIGNVISFVGSILLFSGYFLITGKGSEKLGMVLNGVGSLVLCFAFYIFDSMAFMALNVGWVFISINGYLCRSAQKKVNSKAKPHPIANSMIYIPLVFFGLYFVVQGEHVIVAWMSIVTMLFAYFLFANEKLVRFDYIVLITVANILSMIHLYHIQNYSSLVQTVISVGVSIFALVRIERAKGALDMSCSQ